MKKFDKSLWITAAAYALLALLIASLVGIALITASTAEASNFKRSTKARHDFQRANPCPANGNTKGPCPGYVIDHVIPLCANGPDTPENMQWQTIAEAREKDRIEVAKCRAKKKGE